MSLTSPIVFIHEFFTGGGFKEDTIPADLAGEGLAMLRGLLSDFYNWGHFRTLTSIDARLSKTSLPADGVVSMDHRQYRNKLPHLIAQSNAVLIIAPENDNILSSLSTMVEKKGVLLLGSSALGTALAADKWACFQRFAKAGIPTPNTWRVNLHDASDIAEKKGFPLVAKPIDGAGSHGVCLLQDRSTLKHLLVSPSFGRKNFLLQRYLDGQHYSMSMLVTTDDAKPLSLNEQFISIGMPFIYNGGSILTEHPHLSKAIATARHAISLIPGLTGYVGVDMVLVRGTWYVIEINPRFTTSYVGLRRVININIAEAIWQVSTKKTFPREKIQLLKKYPFHKEDCLVT